MPEVNINIWSLPAAFMLETDLAPDMVDGINDYLDRLLESDDRRSHAGTLVGQIDRGQQLTMDYKAPELRSFAASSAGWALNM